MAERRAVITGIGCVTPIGTGARGLWQGVLQGRSAVRLLDRFDTAGYRSRAAAQVDDFDPAAYMDRKAAQRSDRFAQFALVAAGMALEDGSINAAEVQGERVGVFMGSALGGAGYAEGEHTNYISGGLKAVNPGLALSVFGGAASCNIAIHYGFVGPNETNGMSCAAGALAIGRALWAIRSGEVDMCLAGGAEAPLAPLCFGAFAVIRAMSTNNENPEAACRPFDTARDGFVMGEGAAVLVIEEREAALRRGARPYAELVGFGTSNDAYHMTAPRPDGSQAARAMPLNDAHLSAEQVGYINAHGSSTPMGDRAEALAIRRALGAAADAIPVSGTKALYGHPLGASGAIEAAITALSLHHGYLPGTCNLQEPDPAGDLRFLRQGQGLERRARWALSNSVGFGGINACLALAQV
jgi:3-oxoacyl-[acyl-carrier-protein] synthase II